MVPVQSIAANGLSERVSVVHRDVGLLQRGREVRPLGANIAIADMFDAGKAKSQDGTSSSWFAHPGLMQRGRP